MISPVRSRDREGSPELGIWLGLGLDLGLNFVLAVMLRVRPPGWIRHCYSIDLFTTMIVTV